MSDVKIAIARADAPGSTGNQDITTSDLGGSTPKAVLFITTFYGGTLGTEQANFGIGVGMAISSTERYCFVTRSNDNASTTFTKRESSNSSCCRMDETSGGGTFVADFVSFIADGVRINWSATGDANKCSVTAIFFAGADIDVDFATFSPNGTENSATSVTLAFEANILFCISGLNPANNRDDPLKYTVGVVTNDGTNVDQFCTNFTSLHNKATSEIAGVLTSDGGAHHIGGTPSLRYRLEYGNFSATGFDATTREDSGSTAHVHAVLAIKLPSDVDAQVDQISLPASTGVASFANGRAFKPQFAMFGLFRGDTADQFETDGRPVGGWGVCTATAEFSNTAREEDNVGTTNSASLTDDQVMHLDLHSGPSSVDYIAAFDSFQSDGVDLDFSEVRAAGGQAVNWMLTIEEVVSITDGEIMAALQPKTRDVDRPPLEVVAY